MWCSGCWRWARWCFGDRSTVRRLLRPHLHRVGRSVATAVEMGRTAQARDHVGAAALCTLPARVRTRLLDRRVDRAARPALRPRDGHRRRRGGPRRRAAQADARRPAQRGHPAAHLLDQPWPANRYDHVVLSEVCYYLDPCVLRAAMDREVPQLAAGATVLAAHWRHPVADYLTTGDQANDVIAATAGLHHLGGYRDADVAIDVFATGTPISVAARTAVPGAKPHLNDREPEGEESVSPHPAG